MFNVAATVRIECANMSQMNKIRTWARKRNAEVRVNRYSKDAYEGRIDIRWPSFTDRNAVRPEVARAEAESLLREIGVRTA